MATTGKIVAAVLAVALNALLTRMLAPDAVGVYYLLVSIVTVCGLVSQLGVHQAIVRALAGSIGLNRTDISRRAIKAAFMIVILGAVMVSVPYAFGIGRWLGATLFESSLVSDVAILTAIWICMVALQMLVSQMFRGIHWIGYATLFEGTSTAAFVVVMLACVWFAGGHLDIQDVLVITLGALSITILTGLFLLRRPYLQMAPAAGADVRGMLRVSLPIFVASTAVMGITEAHIWILGSVKAEQDVAIYGAAYRLAKFVVVPLLIVNSIIPPMIAQFFAQGKTREVERILRATATVAGLPSVIVAIAIAAGAPSILSLIYGEFYVQGANVLIIVVAAQTINMLTGSPGVLLMMSDRQAVVMKIALVCGALGLITSAALVKPLGPTGVALGVAVGLSTHNIGMWLYCRSQLGIKTHMGMQATREIIFVLWRKVMARFN